MIDTTCPHCQRPILVQAMLGEHGVSTRVQLTFLKKPDGDKVFTHQARRVIYNSLLLAGCYCAGIGTNGPAAAWLVALCCFVMAGVFRR